MTAEATGPRANSKGDPCPPWCTADHTRLLIPGKPQHGPSDSHRSDAVGYTDTLTAMIMKYSGTGRDGEPEVYLSTIYGRNHVFLAAAQVKNLVLLLEANYGEKDPLAGLLRAAAAAACTEETL